MLDHDLARRRDDAAPTRRSAGEGPAGPQARLLDLQRSAGNSAVASLIQRAPDDGGAEAYDAPASTDAPDRKKVKKAPPKTFKDFTARILKYEVDGGKTVITIGAGEEQGARKYTPGSLLDKGDKEYEDFTIDSAESGRSTARVDARPDKVRENPQVRVKASQYESQEGKGD